MAALAALLPKPVYEAVVSDDEEDIVRPSAPSQSQQVISTRIPVPPYGQRKGWKPTRPEDYGDGGAYPECHVAQYPLEMGRKKASSGNTLALQVDSEGNVRYDAIAHQGQRPDKHIQSQFKDLEVQATADKTRAALEKLVNGKIKAAQPKNCSRYKRIIKMSEIVEDPLEPPRFKHKKIPRGPSQSPPRKATAAEQKEWMIPPCISNWKNNKDGRGLQDSLFVADRHAREEVRQRSLMQQKLMQKEKASKEENLRMLAQRAREERGWCCYPNQPAQGQAAYESLSGQLWKRQRLAIPTLMIVLRTKTARRIRDEMRQEKRREREREMRMNNMGAEQRAKAACSSAESGYIGEGRSRSCKADIAIYKARGNIAEGNDDSFGGGTDEGIGKALDNDRFGLGQVRVGFEGANEQEVREGPVQFEKDTGDVFGLNQFLDEAKTGKKRGLDTTAKRQQLEKASERE
ncbi:SKIP/SNW domain-containing protein [Desarmillaria tabescens]|uniref:Pre-mRNA-processing protein 45 n=1 Tax=Armillaria tabescens TaxID=1929756 RepID=A0AA39NDV2_ARMTA|nr:SKIP/SNW domain-containing protein [Desarmillaria tabescens]KAK0463791.1 SKIP/SNW domain-containing protein [Desarmillaria tabescens]